MRNVSKIVLVALAAIVLVSGVAVLTPRAVHAVVATFVRDVDNAARHPWASTCGFTASASSGNSCDITVPSNVEVVLQMVDISALADKANVELSSYLTLYSGGTEVFLYPIRTTADPTSSLATQAAFTLSGLIQVYADPSSTITCGMSTKNANPITTLQGSCTVSGYMVTLP